MLSKRILELLINNRRFTVQQIALSLDHEYDKVLETVKNLYAENRLYIAAWRSFPEFSLPVPAYARGDKEDAIHPDNIEDPRMSHKRIFRSAREVNMPVFRHWQDIALFGEPSSGIYR